MSENGSLCDAPTDCRDGYACVPVEFTATGRLCSSGALGTRCVTPDDCRQGPCVRDSFDRGTCAAAVPLGSPCERAFQCQTGYCGGVCTTGEQGASCSHPEDCRSGRCDPDPTGALDRCGAE